MSILSRALGAFRGAARRAARPALPLVVAALAASATSAPRPASAQDAELERPLFDVHGYLTQAAAVSRGGQVFGIRDAATVNYRRAALLGRFLPTTRDQVVVQVASRRLGDSPAATGQVKLDWVFLDHGFTDATRLRVGRVPLPWGIYSETRYVGTLLPFYQAPSSFYRETDISTESIDGAVLSHEAFGESRMPVEVSVYAGAMDFEQVLSLPAPPLGAWTYGRYPVRARAAGGVQLWLTTPLPGLRVGGGLAGGSIRGGVDPEGTGKVKMASASVDGTFDRLTARAEAFYAGVPKATVSGGYVQLGYRVSRPLSLSVQYDHDWFTLDGVPVPPTFAPRDLAATYGRDVAAAATWRVTRALQLRVEAHATSGYKIEEGIALDGPARRGRHFITSLSTSF